jgi:hypothetical protein
MEITFQVTDGTQTGLTTGITKVKVRGLQAPLLFIFNTAEKQETIYGS